VEAWLGSTGKNKKQIGMMKDEAAGKITTEFAALRAKLYSYRMDGKIIKSVKLDLRMNLMIQLRRPPLPTTQSVV